MFCPYCGETMEATEVYCPNCGQRIPSGASEKTAGGFDYEQTAPPVSVGRYTFYGDDEEEREELVPLAEHGHAAKKSPVLPVILTICAVVSAACIILLVGHALQANGVLRPSLETTSSVTSGAESVPGTADVSKPEEAADVVTATISTKRPQLLLSLFPLEIANAEASSSFGTPADDFYHGPAFAVDGDESTSWQEGVPGGGKGEWITVHLTKERKVQALALKLGNWRDEEAYKANHRPHVMTLKVGGQEFLLNFKDVMKEHYVVLSEPVRADSLTLVLEKRYKGTETTDNCITEIAVYG